MALSALLPELAGAIERGTPERRADTARKITQLFIRQAPALSEAQVELFDDVLGRLIADMEARVLAELSGVLAPVPNAPPLLVRRFAHDDEIAVAEPVLAHSPRLGQNDLAEIAGAKGQAHLRIISARPQIEETVTDVLLRRGDRDVLQRLAANMSAQLSAAGSATLVRRAAQDELLTLQVGQRHDIPDTLFNVLVTQASAAVQAKLLASASPARAADIRRALAQVEGEMRRPPRDFEFAEREVAALAASGRLNEGSLAAYARARKYEQTAAALSVLSLVPLASVDRLMSADKPDPVLILCKASGFGWSTALAVLRLRFPSGSPVFGSAAKQFERLAPASTQRIIQFWRTRPSAAG